MTDMNVKYHRVIPENNVDYGEFQQADFILSYRGRALELGSIRIEGELEVKTSSAAITTDTNIFLDPMVGAHSLANGFTTTLGAEGSGRVVENFGDSYGRYVKMAKTATEGNASQHNSSAVCELRCSLADQTNALIQGVKPGIQPDGSSNILLSVDPDFSFKPSIALNAGRGNLPYERAGEIKITMTMERNSSVFHGKDVDATTSYNIKNLRLAFRSRAMSQASSEPLVMRTKLPIKSSLASNFANIQTLVPAVCTGFSASFLPQAEENALKKNNYRLAKLPNLTETQILVNDSTNQLVSYVIRNNSDLIGRYIDSFLDTGRNRLSRQRTANGDGFGIGQDFSAALDLSSEKISIQVQSAVDPANAFLAYLYFHSFVSV